MACARAKLFVRDLVMMKQKSIFAIASKVTETLGCAEVAQLVEHDLAPKGHGYDLGKVLEQWFR